MLKKIADNYSEEKLTHVEELFESRRLIANILIVRDRRKYVAVKTPLTIETFINSGFVKFI